MASASKLRDRARGAKRRVARRLADRATRRRILLVLVTVAAVGALAAVKGLIGYFVFSSKSTRLEVALAVAAVVAAVFALGERKVASALESRFNRNTRKHREALAALRDELAEIPDRKALETRLVARFDALFDTSGTTLFIDDGAAFVPVAHSKRDAPVPLAHDDALVMAMRETHAAVVPCDVGSPSTAPLAWPLRSRGRLIGILEGGEHDYLESFDPTEVEAVAALADAAAANLALLDPSLASHLVRTPGNLPPVMNAFVGREGELAQCRGLLAQSRFLTLTGFGGAGKSRLAREIAQGALATHRAGVWWVELADAHDEAGVHAAVASALRMTANGERPVDVAGIARHCGSADTLIVLDTCEHVRDACAHLAATLLRDCPRLTVLATSQSPLGVHGERDFAVPPLMLADPGGEAGGASDAVRLFVERAKAVVPGFEPTPDDLREVAGIVRDLDGIPLAIELAAARMRVLSLSAIREHLAESLRLLAGGDRADARHETMRASIAWSYDPLEDAEQRLLRRLSVFAGGFTLEAAAEVATGTDDPLAVLDPLSRLVEASLVLVVRRDDAPRYHLPLTLRQFLAERLERDPDAHDTRLRHALHFTALAAKETVTLHRREASRALARLDLESANLDAAHAFWLVEPDGSEAALALAHALAPYWRDRGLAMRARERLRATLAPPASSDTRSRVLVLLDLANFDADRAGEMLAEASRIALALGALDLRARALAMDGLARIARGEVDPALRSMDEAVALARAANDADVLRDVLDDRGEALARAERWQDAATSIDESLALARTGEDTAALHVAVGDAARVAIARGDLARARMLLRESVDLALASSARLDGEHDLEVASLLAAAEGDAPRAARYAGAATAARAALGDVRMLEGDGPAGDASAAMREALGEVGYAMAFEGGHRLTLAQGLAEARDWLAGAAG